MDKKIFFGLVRKKGVNSSPDNFSEPEYSLYLVNDTDSPIQLKQESFGGFKTYDDMAVISTPQDTATDITIEPHGYVLYTELYADSFDGAGQYRAYVETENGIKRLEFYTSRGAGFMGSLIPCLNMYGRIIHPHISN